MVNEFDFGSTQYHLKEIIDNRGISIKQMARELNMQYGMLKRYCSDDIKRFDVEVITKICFYLDIDYRDIFTYVPPIEDEEEKI